MRSILVGIIVLASAQVSAQDNFSKQLRDIINDTASSFANFRGDETMHGETVKNETIVQYVSRTPLENTTRNFISLLTGNEKIDASYNALIADSSNLKGAKKICDAWKKKILAVIGNGFEVKKKINQNNDLSNYGWVLKHGGLTISILSVPDKYKELYAVGLSITYSR